VLTARVGANYLLFTYGNRSVLTRGGWRSCGQASSMGWPNAAISPAPLRDAASSIRPNRHG